MTRAYNTLIGDGREVITAMYEINGEPDDFDIEIIHIVFNSVDIIGCLLTQQLVEIEMEIIKHHKHLMSGLADI